MVARNGPEDRMTPTDPSRAAPVTADPGPRPFRRPGPVPARERGSLLIWAAIVVLIVLGVVAAGVRQQQAGDAASRLSMASDGQARAVAEAGLVDGFAWFRRQQSQPVTAFAPVLDLAASPPVNETDDAAIGLVREYEIQTSLWGRYEVRRAVAAETFTDQDGDGLHDDAEPFVDADGDGRWDPARGTRDVTSERGLPGAGAVWLLESHGFLYERPRADLPLNAPPNRLVASARVASELRRLTITPPAAAAVCAASAASSTVGSRGRLRGGAGAGLAYAQGTGTPVVQSGGELTGTPPSTAVPGYAGSLEAVFGVSQAELMSMADVSTASMAGVPSPVGDYTLVVIAGDATFTAAQPLAGTGIVVVLGSCTISASSNSYFGGLLWVQGSLTVRAPCYLHGSAIVGGALDVRGTGGDAAELEHDPAVLNELLLRMGQYRHSKAVFVPGSDPVSSIAGG